MEMKNIADGSKFGSSTATMGKAIGGKTARPCDVCRRERSRWYCAADEAYLCDDCDGSVHTANSVARRHERMRLEPIKAEPKREDHSNYNSAFMATRKRTRTSRPHPHGNHRSLKPKTVKDEFRSPVPVEVPVPQNSPSEEFRPAVDDDDDLLHKVPVFVPLAEEFCVSTRTSNLPGSTTSTAIKIDRTSPSSPDQNYSSDCARNPAALANHCDLNHFLDSETDLCEFAVDMEMDMESIIGQGLDEGLGVLGSLYGSEKDHHRTSNKRDYNNCRSSLTRDSAAQRETDGASSEPDHPCAEDGDGSLGWLWGRVKVEDQKDAKTAQLASDTCHKIDPRDALDARVKVEDPDESWDTIELNIDCNELAAEEEEELDEGQEPYTTVEPSDIKLRGDHVDQDVKIKLDLDSIFRPSVHTDFSEEKKLISLRLNYEDVLTAWSDRGSPWACGKRPESVSDDCSSDGAGLVPDLSIPNGQLGEQVELGQVPVMNNGGGHGGREARVLRYREKRRTRLFSKKIRYEVRKLNAEKRPRMKGRFVKRTSRMSSD